MSRIISWFLEYILVSGALKVILYGLIASFIGAYVLFISWFFSKVSDLYGWINTALSSFSTSGGVSDAVLGLMSCSGITDGLNAGLPLFLTSLSIIVIVIISREFYSFSLVVVNLVSGLIKK
jgi:hypothetical protein